MLFPHSLAVLFQRVSPIAVPLFQRKGGSRNLVGIAIQLSDSEEEKLFVHDSMQVSPE